MGGGSGCIKFWLEMAKFANGLFAESVFGRRRDRWTGAKGVSGLWCRKGGGLVVVVVVAAAGYRGDRRVEGVLRRVV
jgi:hypothetical protein